MKRETRFWKVLRHINAYVSNKWPLKFACAYLNTHNGSIFVTLVRYSSKLHTFVHYFFVLGKSIFLHFPSIWNKF
ncbi:hypothetical protein T01_10562 [Trichinella spiralis]|uniref:Uncharacterized protein n=1 Tax=Trichinella spiralis TaxID=6334 RepID=A0A0V1B7N8_TRISP|nr:hypothetical protein T01_10562 [Trichinella spiralis]